MLQKREYSFIKKQKSQWKSVSGIISQANPIIMEYSELISSILSLTGYDDDDDNCKRLQIVFTYFIAPFLLSEQCG